MADVTQGTPARRGSEPTDRRGQLILLTGIVLAVVLVGLALVINSTIFTANLATRQSGAAQDPGQVVNDVTRSIRPGIGQVNAQHAGDSYTDLYGTHLTEVVTAVGDASARSGAASGTSVSVATVPASAGGYAGTRIADDDATDGFADRQGLTDWTVADGHLRAFELTVDRTSLADDPANALEVVLRAPDTTVEAAVYEDGDDVAVEVTDTTTSEVSVCRGPADSATVDITGGSVAGRQCEALSAATDATGVYGVAFENGGQVQGTYELTVDRATTVLRERVNRKNGRRFCATTDDTAPAGSFYAAGAGDPYVAPAIYTAAVDIVIQGDRQYTTRQSLTPGLAGDATTVPKVASLSVDNAGTPDTEFDVAWSARDPDGELSSVALTLEDASTGDSVTKESNNIDAKSAADTVTVDVGDGGPVTVALTVTDTDGNSRTVRQNHRADGDDTGCTTEGP